MGNACDSMQGSDFQQVASFLSNANSMIREELQQTTSTAMKTIINNLKSGKPISDADLELVKMWIIGDASAYIEMENNFNDWVEEFKRLKSVLARYEGKDCSLKDLYSLRGIMEDAIRVSYDIHNYLEKKERVDKFENATRDKNNMKSEVLVRVLEGSLESPDF
jgi:hypothetical protein